MYGHIKILIEVAHWFWEEAADLETNEMAAAIEINNYKSQRQRQQWQNVLQKETFLMYWVSLFKIADSTLHVVKQLILKKK